MSDPAQGTEPAARALQDRYEPLVLIGLAVLLPVGFVGMAEIFLQTDLPAVGRMQAYMGYDYSCFYQASLDLLAGRSPYSTPDYVTPPLGAIVNLPLALLGFHNASLCFSVLTVGSLVLGYGMLCWELFEPGQEEGTVVYWSGLLLMLFSTPVLFLIDRGNIDGIVLLLLCLGLSVMRRHEMAGGILLAVAAALKLYPLLLLAPLAIFGRRRAVAGLLLGLLLCVAATPGLWMELLTDRLPRRLRFSGVTENASLANLFVVFGSLIDNPKGSAPPQHLSQWIGASYAVYAALLVLKMWSDWRVRHQADATEKLVRTLLYFPFLVAIPKVSFHYTLVVLFALVPALLVLHQREAASGSGRPLRLTALGVGLSQFPATAYEAVTHTRLTHAAPALGLFAVMLGSVLLGWRKVR